MSLLYVIQPRKNPQDRTKPALYYLQARKRGVMDFEKLLVLASEETTLDPDEIRLSLHRAFKKAEEYLDEGYSISLGDIGHIQLSINSEGSATPKEVGAHKVKRIRCNFAFSRSFMKRRQNVGIEEYPDL